MAVNGATAHPHYEADGTAYNMGNSYGKHGEARQFRKRRLVAAAVVLLLFGQGPELCKVGSVGSAPGPTLTRDSGDCDGRRSLLNSPPLTAMPCNVSQSVSKDVRLGTSMGIRLQLHCWQSKCAFFLPPRLQLQHHSGAPTGAWL